MKGETELVNISIIYYRNIVGNKSEFAVICGYHKTNKEFRDWLNKLIDLKILERYGNGERSNIILYKINKKNTLKFIERHESFKFLKKIFYDHYEGPFRH